MHAKSALACLFSIPNKQLALHLIALLKVYCWHVLIAILN